MFTAFQNKTPLIVTPGQQNMAKLIPDVHREMHRVTVLGDVVAVELSIRGTSWGR